MLYLNITAFFFKTLDLYKKMLQNFTFHNKTTGFNPAAKLSINNFYLILFLLKLAFNPLAKSWRPLFSYIAVIDSKNLRLSILGFP